MSMIGNKNKNMQQGTPLFREFKKQASFYLKEKIKTARLALTDVTPAQLLTEEATDGNPWPPDAPSMSIISKSAFEVDDYWRIVDILHKRLARFEKMNWRASYKALLVLEHLLTHGPESVAEEFQTDRDAIHEMESFQYIDERGFNWGLTVRNKSARVNKLIERGPLLKEERERSRKVSRGIQGFGSFCSRSSAEAQESSVKAFGRSNSKFNDHGKYQFLCFKALGDEGCSKSSTRLEGLDIMGCSKTKQLLPGKVESKPLVGGTNGDHPFNDDDQSDTSTSLLSTQL